MDGMGWDGMACHAFYLGDHLVLEDLLLVEDLDGDILSGLDVPGELDLGEGAFAEGPAELVPPHTGPAHGRAHLPVCLSVSLPGLRPVESAKKAAPLRIGRRPARICLPVRVAAEGLRPLLVAGSPLDEYLPVLLALLPLPHQASLSLCSLTGVSVRPLRAAAWDGDGMGWRPERQGREGNGGDGGGGSGW